MVLLRFDQ